MFSTDVWQLGISLTWSGPGPNIHLVRCDHMKTAVNAGPRPQNEAGTFSDPALKTTERWFQDSVLLMHESNLSSGHIIRLLI